MRFFLIFFLENELCAMRDFFFYCVFGPLFFFFAKKRKILPLRGKIFHFFSDKQKKKKKLSKARPMRKIGFHIPMRASFWDKPFFSSWPYVIYCFILIVWLPRFLIFKQGFRWFLLHYREFSHQISPHNSEKYDSTFGTKITVYLKKKMVDHVRHL